MEKNILFQEQNVSLIFRAVKRFFTISIARILFDFRRKIQYCCGKKKILIKTFNF